MPGLGLACYIVAIILALLAAIPPVPYSGSLLALSVAFGWAGHLL
jgi:hypothetical protein